MIKSETSIRNMNTSIVIMMTVSVATLFMISTQVGLFLVSNHILMAYAEENSFELKKTDTINASKIVNAPIDKTWNVVSDLNKSADYWPITIINIVEQTNDTLERNVTIPAPPFMDNKAHQILSIDLNQHKVIEKQTQGVVTGIKTISVMPISGDPNKSEILVVWDLDMSKVPGLGKGFAKGGISNSVNEALEKMAEAVA